MNFACERFCVTCAGGQPLRSSEAAGGSSKRAPSGATAVQGLSTGKKVPPDVGSADNKTEIVLDSR